MAKRKPRRHREDPTVPVEAFSDIAFLLLTFFLIVTTLQTDQGIEAEFPAGEQSQEQTQEDQTNVVHLSSETIAFNERKLALDELRQVLLDLDLPARLGQDKIVLVEATGAVPYRNYYPVIAAINAAGGTVAIVEPEDAQE